MREFTNSRWFALSEVLLVLVSGMTLYLFPVVGGWALILPLLPWCVRFASRQLSFQRTVFDWLILIFVITAAVGYWAAYDKKAALHKFWLILLAVLFYYALSRQPKENLGWISGIFFFIGVGVSIYFFLTHDFVALPRKLQVVNSIGRWIMQVRPQVGWKPVHPNYVSGIAAITLPLGFYPLWRARNKSVGNNTALYIAMFLSFILIAFTIFMATSRGVLLALLSAAGVWVLWRVVDSPVIPFPGNKGTIFPILVLIYLVVIVAFLYAGPASMTGPVATQSYYGNGSRAELFMRSFYLLKEFPFTGGGLDSFPGLYSYYMLGIPVFYLVNSHNLFLDVAIEQGLLGGASYLLLFLASIWLVSRSIVAAASIELKIFGWLTLFVLITSTVHGMVDDYLYNGNGALLSLSLIGISIIASRESLYRESFVISYKNPILSFAAVILILVCILSWNKIQSAWNADLGAVQMAQVELAGFPTNQWATKELVPQLEPAQASLRSALRYDPSNQTANYHLGLISLLRQDFQSASLDLETAHKESPGYRGITKNLGYSYVWLGEMEKAKALLAQIPEASDELNVYVWWWRTQQRVDLSDNASEMLSQLKASTTQ